MKKFILLLVLFFNLLPYIDKNTVTFIGVSVVHAQDNGAEKKGKKKKQNSSASDDAAKAGFGSYTVHFKSGKTYSGKGDQARANESAKRVGDANNDKADKIDWKTAANDEESFKDEDTRIQNNGGVKSEENYNKIESKGKTIKEKQAKEKQAKKNKSQKASNTKKSQTSPKGSGKNYQSPITVPVLPMPTTVPTITLPEYTPLPFGEFVFGI